MKTKVAYNACHGGFGLSAAGGLRYAELKGFKVWPEPTFGGWLCRFWRCPPEDRPIDILSPQYDQLSEAERAENERLWDGATLDVSDIPRTDPDLVRVVEELGDAANTKVSKLKIAEVEKGSRYRIDEYDGFESVMTIDDYEWEVA